jgi:hypothetical protein
MDDGEYPVMVAIQANAICELTGEVPRSMESRASRVLDRRHIAWLS